MKSFCNTYKYILISLLSLVVFISFGSNSMNAQTRQRNLIYVIDCTGSMAGFNGSPNVWDDTKKFLKEQLEKEAKENPESRIVILPFQDKVHTPIKVDLGNINWPRLNNVLDDYVKNLTATNICDSWIEAEKYIDETRYNYLILMTDGLDNVGGSARQDARAALLAKILAGFCGKYKNTRGAYLKLTAAANLPKNVEDVIRNCDDIDIVDITDGSWPPGIILENEININTRDLPIDIPIGFSTAGKYNAEIINGDNDYVKFSLKDNLIGKGQLVIHVESKLGDNVMALNKAIGSDPLSLFLAIKSDEVKIINPEIEVVLHPVPLRTLNFTTSRADSLHSELSRVNNFLWIKGNTVDTLNWDLEPLFNEYATLAHSCAEFQLHSTGSLSDLTLLYNGSPVDTDSIISVKPEVGSLIQLLVPHEEKNSGYKLELTEISSKDLDRINDQSSKGFRFILQGKTDTHRSLIEIIVWILLCLIVVLIILWFLFIRDQIYPKFKKGTLVIQSPYFATIKTKGNRMIVFTSQSHSQSWLDRLVKGKIIYNVNPIWTSDVEIVPSGKNMRFRSPSGVFTSTPSPVFSRGCSYEVFNPDAPTTKVDIFIQ